MDNVERLSRNWSRICDECWAKAKFHMGVDMQFLDTLTRNSFEGSFNSDEYLGTAGRNSGGQDLDENRWLRKLLWNRHVQEKIFMDLSDPAV